ncbi:hypothetical protein FOG24_29660 [Klebsiella grimontii]|nr:hypothetical protein [Klebsiella grimontii]MBZ7128727.1 hypothetical protein [Klebsiella grimontii]MBZ7341450.1 hypothetical protein [Klebsiella grimontii]MDR4267964.1 hypothetical protein [Klebsiella grimontii]
MHESWWARNHHTQNVRQHAYSPAKPLPRSATLCVGRDCAHFWHILFFFFFIFSLFFVRAAGAGSGTLKVRTIKGMLSYPCSFAACERNLLSEW